MITRTTIGADFEGALTYGAGLNQRGAGKKAALIASSNLIDVGNPRGLAAEMQAVAGENTRCKNPVWHTSLSWAEGEQLSRAQKLQAAERYCELIGANWDAHQVAVYEHKDKKHAHIHIYFNRVPVMGGPALDTGHNYARNLKANKVITQELGLHPLPTHRQSFNDRRPPVQDTRQVVRAALVEAMNDPQVQSIEQLQARLAARGIEARLKRSQAGQLVGVSFRQGEAAVTGQEVGMKAAQLRDHYEPAPRQAQDQVPPPVAADVVPGQQPAREQLRQALADVLATATDGATFQQALTRRGISWEVQQDAAGQRSMRFTQGGHAFAGTELSPAFSVEGMKEQMKANRQAQQPQPAAPLVPVVQEPKPAAPEQRPVAAQPSTPELKPAPQKPKQAPAKKIKHRR
jgi:hypothetical protein